MRILLIFSMIFSVAFGQKFTDQNLLRPNTSYGTISYRGAFERGLFFTAGRGAPDTTYDIPANATHLAALYRDTLNHVNYYYAPENKTWSIFSGGSGGSYLAGTWLTLSGSTFNVDTTQASGKAWTRYLIDSLAGTLTGTTINYIDSSITQINNYIDSSTHTTQNQGIQSTIIQNPNINSATPIVLTGDSAAFSISSLGSGAANLTKLGVIAVPNYNTILVANATHSTVARAAGISLIGAKSLSFQTYAQQGLEPQITINFKTLGIDSFPTPAQLPTFKTLLNDYLINNVDGYGVRLISFFNEENNPIYRPITGAAATNAINAMSAAVAIAHNHGYQATGGGITTGYTKWMTWRWLMDNGRTTEANTFASNEFPSVQIAGLANWPTDTTNGRDVSVAFTRAIVAAYDTIPIDFMNVHLYFPSNNTSNTSIDTSSFRLIKQAFFGLTHKNIITHEIGQYNNSSTITAQILSGLKANAYGYGIYYSGDKVGGVGAVALQDSDLVLRPQGVLFANTLQAYNNADPSLKEVFKIYGNKIRAALLKNNIAKDSVLATDTSGNFILLKGGNGNLQQAYDNGNPDSVDINGRGVKPLITDSLTAIDFRALDGYKMYLRDQEGNGFYKDAAGNVSLIGNHGGGSSVQIARIGGIDINSSTNKVTITNDSVPTAQAGSMAVFAPDGVTIQRTSLPTTAGGSSGNADSLGHVAASKYLQIGDTLRDVGYTSKVRGDSIVRILSTKINYSDTANRSNITGVVNSFNINTWGDSFTQDYSPLFSTYVNGERGVYNGGVAGETSTQIRTRFFTQPYGFLSNLSIIWAGRNNFADTTTVKADVAAMVAALGTNARYVVLSVFHANLSTEWVGTTNGTIIDKLNQSFARDYGYHYLDAETYIINQYNPSLSQDVIDFGHKVTPTSLRRDSLHLNFTLGYPLFSNYLANYILNNIDVQSKIVTTKNLTTLVSDTLGAIKALAPVNQFFAGYSAQSHWKTTTDNTGLTTLTTNGTAAKMLFNTSVDISPNSGAFTTGATGNNGRLLFRRYTDGTTSGAYVGYINTATDLGVGIMSSGGGSYTTMGAGGTERLRMINGGNIGVRLTSPTAYLHLAAGTATTGTAPIKLTTGTLTSPFEAGAIEYLDPYFYISSAAKRDTIAPLSLVRSLIGTGTSYYNTNIGTGYNLTVPFTNNVRRLAFVAPLSADSTTTANTVTVKFDTSTYGHSEGYYNTKYAQGVAGNYIQNQYATRQVASANFDSAILRKLTTDSLVFGDNYITRLPNLRPYYMIVDSAKGNGRYSMYFSGLKERPLVNLAGTPNYRPHAYMGWGLNTSVDSSNFIIGIDAVASPYSGYGGVKKLVFDVNSGGGNNIIEFRAGMINISNIIAATSFRPSTEILFSNGGFGANFYQNTNTNFSLTFPYNTITNSKPNIRQDSLYLKAPDGAVTSPNQNGGKLKISSGNSIGLGSSVIEILTASPSTTGTTLNAPTPIIYAHGDTLTLPKTLVPATTGAKFLMRDTNGDVKLGGSASSIVEISGTTQAAVPSTIYIPHNAALTSITVASSFVVGDLYQIVGEGAGKWKLLLNSGQTIVGVGGATTTGTSGGITATDRYCTITLRAVSTTTLVVTTSQGTLTFL